MPSIVNDAWINEKYDELRYTWEKMGLKIPVKSSLKTKLAKSEALIRELNSALNTSNAFSVLLVPPSSKINFPATKKQIGTNYDKFAQVHIDSVGIEQMTSKKWQLFVVYCKTEAIPLNLLPELVEEGLIIVNDHEMPGLNAREYYIYSLTCGNKIDLDSWSLLVKDLDPTTGILPCVRHIGDKYNFSSDHVNSLIGTNSFRPAMEVL